METGANNHTEADQLTPEELILAGHRKLTALRRRKKLSSNPDSIDAEINSVTAEIERIKAKITTVQRRIIH